MTIILYINVILLENHNLNNLIEYIKGFNVKQFDIIFSNPPYNDGLDLKILKSLFEYKNSKKIIFVHPAEFLLDKRFRVKLKNYIRDTNYLEYVYMFWANKLFNIKLFVPCCISIWNTEKTSNKCSVTDTHGHHFSIEINDISVHGKMYLKFKNFINSIIKNNINILEKRVKADYSDMTDYSVRFALIRGNARELDGYNDDFFTLLCQDSDKNKCDHTYRCKSNVDGERLIWSFNNEKERENFLNYCKSKFVRFLLSNFKSNSNLARSELLFCIPWLDFTQEWNDKKLCKEFNISEELWNYINNFIPDYYPDYKSGF
jgi:hypothetical protein